MLFTLGATFRLRHVTLVAYVHVTGAFVLSLFYAKGGFPTWGAPVPMYDVNDLALLLCIALPLAFFISTQSARTPVRLAGWTVTLLIAFSIIATRSRGAFITFAVIVLMIMIRSRGIGIVKRIAPVALLISGFFFASENARDRISTIFTIEDDYNLTEEDGRIAIWKRGMGYMMANPVFGVGAGNFTLAEQVLSGSRGMVAHNSYVEVGAETGVIGLLLFLCTLAFALRELRRLRKRYARAAHLRARAALCDAVFTSLIAWMVGAFFLAWGYSVVLYTVYAMIAGLVIADRLERPLELAPRRDTEPVHSVQTAR